MEALEYVPMITILHIKTAIDRITFSQHTNIFALYVFRILNQIRTIISHGLRRPNKTELFLN
jgi:hypothetical protein